MSKTIHLDTSKPWQEQDLGGDRKEIAKKTICLVRYGAAGDMIQTSALFPIFKKLGYYICLNTNERGYKIIKDDPNVDEFFVQGNDQVDQAELGDYWWKLHLLFHKFVNFSESVEVSLLAKEGRAPAQFWSQKARHRYMNHNYLEFMADIADIPYKGENGRFYPTAEEDEWAKKERKKMGKKAKVILWAMSGSSFHKVNFWVDTVIARTLIHHEEVHFVLTGDDACKYVVGQSWDNEKRVHNWTGGDIRKALAFLPYVDLVMGPETGVLNAAGGLDEVKKIIFLSHSNPEKVTKYWKNTINLEPQNCKCYPCHILHTSNNLCTMVDLREQMTPMIKKEWKEEVYKDILDKPIRIPLCSLAVSDDMIYSAINDSLYRELQ